MSVSICGVGTKLARPDEDYYLGHWVDRVGDADLFLSLVWLRYTTCYYGLGWLHGYSWRWRVQKNAKALGRKDKKMLPIHMAGKLISM